MIRGVIFDLDGTVGYTMPGLQKAMNEMLRSFSYPEHTVEELLQWVNLPAAQWIAGCLPKGLSDAEIKAAKECYNVCYGKYYLETPFYPGVEQLIRNLKAKGCFVGMLSNKQHNHVVGIAKKLSRLPAAANDPSDFDIWGPVGIFDAAWGVSDRFPAKPDPASALAMASAFGLNPEETAFVGDSDVDVYTGRNAGMQQISVTWGYRSRAFHENLGVLHLAENAEELEVILKTL